MVPAEKEASHRNPVNKDLLRFEHVNPSSVVPGASLLSICRTTDRNKNGTATADVSRLPLSESSVLSRVKAFLPIFEEANRKLTTDIKDKGADEFNIEVLRQDKQASYVEMDLALGVADLQDPNAVLAAEKLVGQTACTLLNIDSETEPSIVKNEKDDGILQGNKKKRPKIEHLS